MSENKLQAEMRTEFGKGAARRIRRDDKVPAVLYGHGTDPIHITLPGHDTMLALKHGGLNALLSVDVEGDTQLAIPKQVQRDPIKGFLEHLDLLIVRKGEKVTVEIAVHTTGEAARETVVTIEHSTISVEAEATHIPESIEVDIEGLEAGTQILIKDLTMPKGAVAQAEDDVLVVNITEAVDLPTELETEEGEVAETAGSESDESDESAEEKPAE